MATSPFLIRLKRGAPNDMDRGKDVLLSRNASVSWTPNVLPG